MRISDLSDVLNSQTELGAPIHVQGLVGPPATWAILQIAIRQKCPVVAIFPTIEQAREARSDAITFLRWLKISGRPLATFPTWEQPPYLSVAPSLKTRIERIKALQAFQENGIVFTTLSAMAQATLPPAILNAAPITLTLGRSVGSREALTQQLEAIGYLRIDPVEDPGTYAVRGNIIDVFPISHTQPIRIELFGDEVERLREFDPVTQRSLTSSQDQLPLSQCKLLPAKEVMISGEFNKKFRENLKAFADENGIPRSLREPISEAVENGFFPDHADAMAPWSYGKTHSAWEHLQTHHKVIFVDKIACSQEWENFYSELPLLHKEALRQQLLLPPPNDLYDQKTIDEQFFNQRSHYFFNQGSFEALNTDASPEIPVSIKKQHQVSCAVGVFQPELASKWSEAGFTISVFAALESQLDRCKKVLQSLPNFDEVQFCLGGLSTGFRWPAEKIAFLSDQDILGTKKSRSLLLPASTDTGPSAAANWAGLSDLSTLEVGDLVVHVQHGIGRYQGIIRIESGGVAADFLTIEYSSKDKLYVPVYRLNLLQKYHGGSDSAALDRLGTGQFDKAKSKVRDAVRRLAVDLIHLYAQRKIQKGLVLPRPEKEYEEFEQEFPFDETVDQLKAIQACLDDLTSGKSMDRLVCGDVGYGKTEVAIRAAFHAANSGKQVVVLVPTTLLAHQHEQSFRARLKNHPLRIDSLSRFKNPKEQKETLASLAEGKVDIVIGTHRLLSRDIRFKNLGLIIIDEEHRFGVEHKEKLKALKVNTHVLTLTATPIPRTLHMSLAGLRDISLITTPPVDRLPIRTYVSKYDESLIQRAIEFELKRGGQVFIVHNRVQSIYEFAQRVQELAPESKVVVGHAQQEDDELEKTMLDFYERRANVLVSTTIIESGIDIPSANTIIINQAQNFGLAQLYQLRGRVGRGTQRGYAYLLVSESGVLTRDAQKRLEVIQRFVELGSGFNVASYDLEIRGGGNLLGPQQSGNIAAVGFDLYMELLEEAIAEIQGAPKAHVDSIREPEIKAPFPAFLDESYVADVHQRLSLYRKLSMARDEHAVNDLESELNERFGGLPREAQNLLWMIRLKILLKDSGIDALVVGPERISLTPGTDSRLDPAKTVRAITSESSVYSLTPESKLVIKFKASSMKDLYFQMEGVVKKLSTTEGPR